LVIDWFDSFFVFFESFWVVGFQNEPPNPRERLVHRVFSPCSICVSSLANLGYLQTLHLPENVF